jgi:Recombination endonuclease VII
MKGFQKGNQLTRKRICVAGHDTDVIGRDKSANCRECRRRASRAAYRKFNDKRRDYRYQTTFRISLAEYNTMFTSQNGLCAGCYRHQTQFKTRFAVDHDHKTGKVRGLLCGSCNWILGKVDDSVAQLQNLMDYLGRYGR